MLIDRLIEAGYLKSPAIIEAFRRVKRQDFLPAALAGLEELDQPLPIGHGQTISQPATVALMFELLEPTRGEKILDVGSGSGWTVALLSEIVGPAGQVWGLELLPELVQFARSNIDKYGFREQGPAEVLEKDGYQGLPEMAPFDRIIVAAAALSVPAPLIEQLALNGRLVMPVGAIGHSQDLLLVTKDAVGRLSERRYPGFAFVPLVKPDK